MNKMELDNDSLEVSMKVIKDFAEVSEEVPKSNIYVTAISTCCKDIQFVNILKKKLEFFNYNVYFPDESETEIIINKQFIEKSFCMLIVLFDSRINKNTLFIEMGYAIAKNVPVVILTEKDMFKCHTCGCGQEVQRDFQLIKDISKLLFYCPLEIQFLDKYVSLLNNKLLTLQ